MRCFLSWLRTYAPTLPAGRGGFRGCQAHRHERCQHLGIDRRNPPSVCRMAAAPRGRARRGRGRTIPIPDRPPDFLEPPSGAVRHFRGGGDGLNPGRTAFLARLSQKLSPMTKKFNGRFFPEGRDEPSDDPDKDQCFFVQLVVPDPPANPLGGQET